MRTAAIDIGNDALKGYFGGLTEELYVPNVIAEIGPSREIVEFEKNPLDGLHVEIVSRALKKGKGIYAVGSLAMQYSHNDELTPDSEKADNDQSVVLLLTAHAVDAVQHFSEKNGVIEATYFLSTGLPLDEAKRGLRKAFKEKLKTAQHEIRFLNTPSYGEKVVRIRFEEVLVNTEGLAAMVDLTTNDDGSVRNEELTRIPVLINDIGGLSTDSAIILPDGSIDNVNSKGLKEGVSPYLDEIIEKVGTLGYKIKSRRALVDIITHESSEERNHIWIKGNRQSIQSIVDEALERLAREEYKHIKAIWDKVPQIRLSYQIGGGSVILRPYLERINEEQNKFPLRFTEKKESIWMIARAYYKLLIIFAQQKGIALEAAAAKE